MSYQNTRPTTTTTTKHTLLLLALKKHTLLLVGSGLSDISTRVSKNTLQNSCQQVQLSSRVEGESFKRRQLPGRMWYLLPLDFHKYLQFKEPLPAERSLQYFLNLSYTELQKARVEGHSAELPKLQANREILRQSFSKVFHLVGNKAQCKYCQKEGIDLLPKTGAFKQRLEAHVASKCHQNMLAKSCGKVQGGT